MKILLLASLIANAFMIVMWVKSEIETHRAKKDRKRYYTACEKMVKILHSASVDIKV